MTPLIFGRYVREDKGFSSLNGIMDTAANLRARLSRPLPNSSVEQAVFLGRIGNGVTAASRSLRLPVERLMGEG